jgi:hypothetical protein
MCVIVCVVELVSKCSYVINVRHITVGDITTVYIKDNNSVAVSSGGGDNIYIAIIDIDSREAMTTIYMDATIYGMAVRAVVYSQLT